MKVALAGTFGHWVHAFDELKDMANVELSGIAKVCEDDDLDDVTWHDWVSEQTPVYGSLRDLLDDRQPDLVIVSCRLDRIAATATEAARARCHLICEKPLALDPKELDELYGALLQNNVRLLAMLTMRTLPVFQTMRRLFREGTVGQAVLANARKSYKWGRRPAWFGDDRKYGGSIGWLGIHGLDMISSATGLRYAAVSAMQGNLGHSDFPGCQDIGGMLLQLENGGHATVSFDYFRPEAAKTHGDDWLRLVGTHGVMEGNASRGWCRLVNELGEHEVELDPPFGIYRTFVEELNGDRNPNPLTAMPDPFHFTQVCIEAAIAAEQGVVRKFEAWPKEGRNNHGA